MIKQETALKICFSLILLSEISRYKPDLEVLGIFYNNSNIDLIYFRLGESFIEIRLHMIKIVCFSSL